MKRANWYAHLSFSFLVLSPTIQTSLESKALDLDLNSFQIITLQDSLESRNAACGEFLGRLNESLAIWGDKLPVEARYVESSTVTIKYAI